MKIIPLGILSLVLSAITCLAENPYLPITEKRTMQMFYLENALGGSISKAVVNLTGETKEQDGKTYYIAKNWIETKEGEKKYPSESLSRVDAEGVVYSIVPGSKVESLALPAANKLKVDFEWKTNAMGHEVTNKVISMDGEVDQLGKKYDGLLVIEQNLGETTKMRSYFKKGIGPVAVSSIKEGGEEKFMFIVK